VAIASLILAKPVRAARFIFSINDIIGRIGQQSRRLLPTTRVSREFSPVPRPILA
jgi:hypothetical protein